MKKLYFITRNFWSSGAISRYFFSNPVRRRRSLSRLVLTALLLTTLGQCNLGQTRGPNDPIEVTGEGRSAVFFDDTGLAYERALEMAFSDAIAKAVGQVVTRETKTYNMQFVSDEISAKSSGLIKRHEILGKELTDNGQTYQVKIKAWVLPAKVRESLANLLDRLGNPRMMFLVHETIYLEDKPAITNESGFTHSETAIFNTLRKKGLRFVDPSVIKNISRRNRRLLNNALLRGNEADALSLARGKADVVILGRAETRDAGDIGEMGIAGAEGMYSAQASVNFKIMDVYSGKIIAQDSAKAASAYVQKVTAAQKALKAAATQVLPKILDQVRDYYVNKPRENDLDITITGLTVGSPELVALKSLLLSSTRCKKITLRQGKGQTIQWRVIYPGTAESLMEEIAVKQKKMGLKFTVVDFHLGAITYKVSR